MHLPPELIHKISDALKRHGGTVTAAARELGVTPRILRYKIKNYGIRV